MGIEEETIACCMIVRMGDDECTMIPSHSRCLDKHHDVPPHGVPCTSGLQMYLKALIGVSVAFLLLLSILIFLLLRRRHQRKFRKDGEPSVDDLGLRWEWVPQTGAVESRNTFMSQIRKHVISEAV